VVTTVVVRNEDEVGPAFASFSREPTKGLIVLPGPVTNAHRSKIIAAARTDRIPAVYPFRFYTTKGGLVSYGVDTRDQYRRAASYIDRILKGEKPADLPVQAPTTYEMVINLDTAKTLGITIPPALLARADEVIE
jgi:putative ABC transport system substrate-binding protein